MATRQDICELQWRVAISQTCACPRCQPRLYGNWLHPADGHSFHPLRGLSWRAHDAWRIAILAVSSSANVLQAQQMNQKWIEWTSRYQLFALGRAAARLLSEQAINQAIDIFSDIFFLGQLPTSKILMRWSTLGKKQLGSLQHGWSPKDTMILWLNYDHAPLRHCARKIICVVLHEMAHAFLDYYACYPWNKSDCAKGVCGKLYQQHVGLTGHGRAWQYLVKNIQQAMPRLLGFEGDLGRSHGMYIELHGGGCIPCHRDLKSLYPWFASHWWEGTVRTRDDDTVLHIRLSTRTPRYGARDALVAAHSRRNSI